MARTTTIQISDDLWDYLNGHKRRGESFNDVLMNLLELEEDDLETYDPEEDEE